MSPTLKGVRLVLEFSGSSTELTGSGYPDLYFYILLRDEAFKAKLLPQPELGLRTEILLLLRVVARRPVPIALVCSRSFHGWSLCRIADSTVWQ